MNNDLANRVAAAVPDTDQQMAWIKEVTDQGIRRPGTSQNRGTQAWCAQILEGMGLDVERQAVHSITSHPEQATIVVWPASDPEQRETFRGLTMPLTTTTDRAVFKLEATEPNSPSNCKTSDHRAHTAGLFHVNLVELPVSLLSEGVLASHDPTNEFDTLVHTLPFGAALGKEVDTIINAGFGAMIGIFDGPWTTSDYFVPYDGIIRSIPGVWLDREQGVRLDKMLEQGQLVVEITTVVENRLSVDYNIIAAAPSPNNDDWIVLGSHHDAPWASAVEDASGIAQVLAQAKAWSCLPEQDRPVSLAFLLSAAHMSEGAGTREFIRSWRHRDKIKLAIHLEHIAVEAEPDGTGGLRPTDRAEVRWWFASSPDAADQERLVASLGRAIAAEDLDRSLVLGPTVFGPMPPTDGGFFHLAGIPMVNLLAAPMYLFDSADTPAMIHQASLVPTSRAAIRLVFDALDGPSSDLASTEESAL